MKPKILSWIYVALGFLLLANLINILSVFQFFNFSQSAIESADNPKYYAIFPFLEIAALLTAIFGFIRLAPWSRLVAFIVIGLGAIRTLGLDAYIISNSELGITDLTSSFAIIDIFLLFLAYKIYTSVPLKTYFENNIHLKT